MTRQGGLNGPGWKVVTALKEWSGDEFPAIALGTKQNRVHLLQYKESVQELWQLNVGGEVNDIQAGDFNGDGLTEIVVASDGYQLYCLNPDGSVRWRLTLGDRVMKVAGAPSKDGSEVTYMAVTDNGGLYMINAQGKIRKHASFSSLIQNAHFIAGSNHRWIVMQNGDLYRSK